MNKISKTKLKQLIKEELESKVLKEAWWDPFGIADDPKGWERVERPMAPVPAGTVLDINAPWTPEEQGLEGAVTTGRPAVGNEPPYYSGGSVKGTTSEAPPAESYYDFSDEPLVFSPWAKGDYKVQVPGEEYHDFSDQPMVFTVKRPQHASLEERVKAEIKRVLKER